MLCELASAGCRNDDKTTDEMQRVDLFSFPQEPGDVWSSTRAEAHKQNGGAGTAELGPC